MIPGTSLHLVDPVFLCSIINGSEMKLREERGCIQGHAANKLESGKNEPKLPFKA